MNETVLQFGAGRFLRGFIDRFISQLNHGPNPVGNVVVVQSTPGSRAARLNEAAKGFPVIVRGIENDSVVERVEIVDSISRALVASEQWPDVLGVARSDALKLVVSNATEAGYQLSPEPFAAGQIPSTLPGKLTAVLQARFQADQEPLSILPCELIAGNAEKLRELVIRQAEQWELGTGFQHFAADLCQWLNNLVDCIISDLPTDDARLAENPLAISAEPFAFLAIERPFHGEAPLAHHPAVHVVDNLEPYYLQKVRVLNGAHTAMVAKYLNSPLDTVQQVLADPAGMRWTRDLLYGEILPTLLGRVENAVQFVDATIDRFRNPFMCHKLADIRLNHEQKVPVRLVPTADDYAKLYGRRPPLLQAAIDTQIS